MASGGRTQIHLNAFLMDVGHHEAAWRHPKTHPERVNSFAHFKEMAQIAENGKLDSLFLADSLALQWRNVRYKAVAGFEPLTLLSALAASTERIGLIATASTTYNEPFHIARKFASLDHISGGRAGWNIVTSSDLPSAGNFGMVRPDHADRYRRAAEFVDVVIKLWDSWEDDAVLVDRDAGVYADADRIHAIEHVGEAFQVKGPLNVPRPPQGHPLLVQAGSSETGKDFAARYAEAVFTAQSTLAEGKAFYADLKARVTALGRNPDHVKILPGIVPVIGGTEAEAKRLEKELEELQVPAFGLEQLSDKLEFDLTGYPLDGPLPEVPALQDIQGGKSRSQLYVDVARRDNLTIRQLLARLGGGRGHQTLAGAPEQIADQLEEWFKEGAADGFNVMPPHLPGGLSDFVEHVVPELQRRGIFRSEYADGTLRERFGLPRPANQIVQPVPSLSGHLGGEETPR